MADAHNHTPDSGATLVELLVTVVIIGIAFVAIIGGMTTSIMGSDIHRKQATSETVLRSYADAIKSESYADCGTYSPAGFTTPTGFDTAITSITYWDGSSFQPAPACTSPDGGLQQISIRVGSSDGRATESLTIIKRRP